MPDRWEQRERSREQKKKLAVQMLQRSSRGPVVATPPGVVALSIERAQSVTTVNKQAQRAPLVIGLLADDGKARIKPVTAIEHLAGHMLHAAEGSMPQMILLWPGSTRAIGLAHAVATIARWHKRSEERRVGKECSS